MSAITRIIPRLDIKGPNLVKGIHMEGLRVLGKPEQFARFYYENGADELFYMDAVASLYERNSLLEIINKTAREIFIPLTVGGGLRSIDDIQTVLCAGADKVALNTAVINRPELIKEASIRFGSSTIVVSIDAIRKADGNYEAYTDYGRESTGTDAYEWAIRAAEIGAGELVITSIDQEGTGRGFDLELTRKISESVSIPVIAAGGAGEISHVYEVIHQGKANAVSLASILHYEAIKEISYDSKKFSEEGNTEYLQHGNFISNIQSTSISNIKQLLNEHGIMCRVNN